MDPRIEKLKTPEECEALIENARARGRDDLVKEARQRIVALRTDAYGPQSPLERQCIEAIYAHEEVLRARHSRRIAATRIWQDVKKLGPFSAVDRAIGRTADEWIHEMRVALGLEAFAFEAIVLQHAAEFSFEAVEQSKARVARRRSTQA